MNNDDIEVRRALLEKRGWRKAGGLSSLALPMWRRPDGVCVDEAEAFRETEATGSGLRPHESLLRLMRELIATRQQLQAAERQLVVYWKRSGQCPCRAREEGRRYEAIPHAPGCATARALENQK